MSEEEVGKDMKETEEMIPDTDNEQTSGVSGGGWGWCVLLGMHLIIKKGLFMWS